MRSDKLIDKAEQAFSNLDAWLMTWDNGGGINGFVVHHHNDKMDSMIPDVLTQASCVLSYLNVYKTTKDARWLLKAKRCADYLLSIYVPEVSTFSSASFEHKPKGDTLVYDALAIFSLMKIYSATMDKKYFQIAEDCLKKLLIGNYWDEKTERFWYLIKDGRKLHALNMGSIAIAAIVEYTRATGDESFLDYARKQASFIIKYQEKSGKLKGAYYYDDAGSWTRVMSIYVAWTLKGMIELYDYTKDVEYLESIRDACDFLYNQMLDPKTKLFYHRYMVRRYGAIELHKGPEWIAAAGASLYCFVKVQEFGMDYNIEDIIEKILDYQYPTGAFPNSRYYENVFVPHLIRNLKGETNWRDAIPVVGWNSQMLEALSLLVAKGNKHPTVNYPFNLKCDDGYAFDESKDKFMISLNSKTVAVYTKKNPLIFYNDMTLADSAFCQKNILAKTIKFRNKIMYAVILFLLYLVIVLFFLCRAPLTFG